MNSKLGFMKGSPEPIRASFSIGLSKHLSGRAAGVEAMDICQGHSPHALLACEVADEVDGGHGVDPEQKPCKQLCPLWSWEEGALAEEAFDTHMYMDIYM